MVWINIFGGYSGIAFFVSAEPNVGCTSFLYFNNKNLDSETLEGHWIEQNYFLRLNIDFFIYPVILNIKMIVTTFANQIFRCNKNVH